MFSDGNRWSRHGNRSMSTKTIRMEMTMLTRSPTKNISNATSSRRSWLPALALPFLSVIPLHVHALGADLGDWVAPTPGHNLFAWYGIKTENSGLYQKGKVVDNRAQLDANVSLVRFTNPVHVGESWIGNPQFALQIAELSPKHMNGQEDASGIGDPFVSFPIFFPLDRSKREYFVFAPFLYLPLGEYDHNDPLNIGENRWKGVFQFGYQRGLSDHFNVELLAEATVYGENDEYGPAKQTLKQKPLYEGRAALSYQFNNPGNSLIGGGLQKNIGGENELDGVDQRDRIDSTAFYVQASTFITPSDQILFGFSRDIDTENGFKMDKQFKLRYLHVF
ncbi:TPA: transporter [Pseudomonas aeruginosa]|nr:transporter [Pseudomonas aeruginosa]